MSRLRFAALASLPLALFACRGGTPPEPAVTDGRTAVPLPAEANDAVRAEMRALLGSLQALLATAPARDTTAMLAAARAAGTPAAADTALEHLLPAEWMTMAMTMHRGFDSLAVAIRARAGTDSLAARLGVTLSSCVSCHSQYRLTVRAGD